MFKTAWHNIILILVRIDKYIFMHNFYSDKMKEARFYTRKSRVFYKPHAICSALKTFLRPVIEALHRVFAETPWSVKRSIYQGVVVLKGNDLQRPVLR